MTKLIEKQNTDNKNRLLSYKMSQKFTPEDLQSVAGAAMGDCGYYSYDKSGKIDSGIDSSLEEIW